MQVCVCSWVLSSNLLGAGEGLITYMRTDGVAIGPPAVQDIRQQIKTSYGQGSLAAEPRVYKYALTWLYLPALNAALPVHLPSMPQGHSCAPRRFCILSRFVLQTFLI